MKTPLRLSIAAIGLAIFNLSTAVAQAQFNYTTENGTITITGYSGPGGDVTIPSVINGLPVSSIGAYYDPFLVAWLGAFSGSRSLTSVTIPESVTSIGVEVLREWTRLRAPAQPSEYRRVREKQIPFSL